MDKLFYNLRNTFAVIIILIIVVSYFAVFLPFRTELKNSLYENYKNIVHCAETSLENHFIRSREAAEVLASRKMIKREITKYRKGEIKLAELKNYSESKYQPETDTEKHIEAVFRFIDDRMIVNYGEQYLPVLTEVNFSDSEENTELRITEDQNFIVTKSIIEDDQKTKLGTAYIIYNLKDILTEISKLNSKKIDFTILKNLDPADSRIDNNRVVEIKRLLNTDYYLKAESPTSLIYEPISSLSYKVMLIVLVTFLIIYLFTINILHKASNRVISRLRKELAEKIRLSETDKMLGIYNRTKFNEELKKEIDRSRRYGNNLALIMFDIDYFKSFNDNYGHQKGDQILKQIVSIVRNKIRENDLLARYGGDEFMIICPETDLTEAEILAERLNRSISNYNCKKANDLSCSFGVGEFKKETDTLNSFIKRVDQALYKAKESGRNRVCS